MTNKLFNGNIIFDKDYVLPILEKYLSIKGGDKLRSLKIEKIVFNKITSFVAKYYVEFFNSSGKILVFGTAHKEGTNKIAFSIMKLLRNTGISGQIPIFYDKKTEALFYLGVYGIEFHQLITKSPIFLNSVIEDVGRKLAKFHKIVIPVPFNISNFKVNNFTLDPLNTISNQNHHKHDFQDRIRSHFDKIQILYKTLMIEKNLSLTHGDFHPRNVIVEKDSTMISIIDFTSVSYAHYCLDLGTFIHQLDFMFKQSISHDEMVQSQKIFLESYFKEKNEDMTLHIRNIIYFFQSLSAIRGAVYFLIDEIYDENSVNYLISQSQDFLKEIK